MCKDIEEKCIEKKIEETDVSLLKEYGKNTSKESLFKKDIRKDSFLAKCIVCPQEKLGKQDKLSFYNQEYLTVKTKTDLKLYRVCSKKEVRDQNGKLRKGKFASPNLPFDKLSAKTDLALAYPFGNRMEVVEEIKVPKGEILQVGYVAPKTTGGQELLLQKWNQGDILNGMSIQVILPANWYEREGWEILKRYPLESRSGYRRWEEMIERRGSDFSEKRNGKS